MFKPVFRAVHKDAAGLYIRHRGSTWVISDKWMGLRLPKAGEQVAIQCNAPPVGSDEPDAVRLFQVRYADPSLCAQSPDDYLATAVRVKTLVDGMWL